MRLLALAGSLRKDSLNKKLLAVASNIATKNGVIVETIDLAAFDMPLYNGDIEEKQGTPTAANRLKELFDAADGIMISAPEYNFSVSGVLKNAFDWMSRIKPQPFKNKHILLMSASPSMIGGNRGLWALRIPLEALGSFVYPEMFSLAVAHEAFDTNNALKVSALQSTLENNVLSFVKYLGSKN